MALPELILPPPAGAWPPDPLRHPECYRGVTLRRALAYCVDVWIIALLLLGLQLLTFMAAVMTLGLLWPIHYLVIPLLVALAYHSLQTSGPAAATLGMRLFGVRVYSVLGGRPTLPQALVHTVCFYATLGMTAGLLLLVTLFNPRRRGLHDFLAGTVVLRSGTI